MMVERVMDKQRLTPLEQTVLGPLQRSTTQFRIVIGVLILIVGAGVFALFRQWAVGLGVTGLSRPVYWGVYITNFVFFIGISHAGTLISAILRVTQAEWRRPITRIAEAITFFALILGLLQVWIDMGRPERFFYPFIVGRFQSPFLWDFTCIGVYLLSSTLYLYLPMIPDLAWLRDHAPDAPAWRRKLYALMSFGWHGGREQRRRLEKSIGVMAIVIIPVAVSVHTVVSWIFGMTMQPMWHSTILGPYFVVGAIFSGIAMLFVLMTIVRKAWHLEKWIGAKQYNYLGLLLLVMSILWGYFTLSEYLTTGYATLTHESEVLHAKVFGEYAPWFWAMVVLNLIVPLAILLRRKGRTPIGAFCAGIAILIGMWIERFMIVAPSLTIPALAAEPAIYAPTLTEAVITGGSLALFVLLFLLFFKVFPAISVWEVEEGEAVEAIQHKAKELAQQAALSG
jgi:Ni/Fe-hydrogenase subunit HybB-like protein